MEEWFQHEDNFFSFNLTTTDGHVGADQECKQSGGHLATISDKETENFINNQIDIQNMDQNVSCLWIGIRNTSNDWVWEDGTKMEYTNWDEGEPNYLDTQHCTNKQIKGIYAEKKPWFNDYCDIAGPSCGRICQKNQDFNTLETWNTISNTLTTIQPFDGNSMSSAIMFPMMILIVLSLTISVLFICYKKRGSRLESEITKETEDVEMQEMSPLNQENKSTEDCEDGFPNTNRSPNEDENILENIANEKNTSNASSECGSVFDSDNIDQIGIELEIGSLQNERMGSSQYKNVSDTASMGNDTSYHDDMDTAL
ncbi:uncharacterized protein LOC120333828 [Styela clava]